MFKLKKEFKPSDRSGRKVNFTEAMVLLLLMVGIMIYGAMIAKFPTGMSLLFSATICGIYGAIIGHKWDEMFSNILNVVKTATPALFILLMVGFISASWIASGTIPYMIYYGLKLIHPSIFLFAAFLLCSIASIATGSSWAIVSSLGMAMGGIAIGLGIPLPITAGAVVSGCFLGDKWSPLSDTPNLSAASTGQNIIKLFTSMIPTSGLGALLSGIVFLVWGFTYKGGPIDTSIVNELINGLSSNFKLNIILLLPVILVFTGAAMKLPIMPVLVSGVAVGAVEAILIQGQSFASITSILWSGYKSATGIQIIDSLLSRGGAVSLLPLVLLLYCAFSFAGIVERIGILDVIMEKLLTIIKNSGSLVLCTILTCIAGVFLSSSVYVSMILNGRMYMPAYKKMKLDTINLTRAITEGSAYIGAMCPWSGGALLTASSLGISTWAYFPYVFSAWFAMSLTVLWAYLGKFSPEEEVHYQVEDATSIPS